jgi:uncharacterized membrane protein YgcG
MSSSSLAGACPVVIASQPLCAENFLENNKTKTLGLRPNPRKGNQFPLTPYNLFFLFSLREQRKNGNLKGSKGTGSLGGFFGGGGAQGLGL